LNLGIRGRVPINPFVTPPAFNRSVACAFMRDLRFTPLFSNYSCSLSTWDLVSVNFNHEEHVLRALANTGASSSIILEAYISKDLIKHDKKNRTTWSTMGGQFITDRIGLVSFSLPEFNLKKQVSWKFHMDDHAKASETYGMIICQDLLGE
jgi:hypothetical protein